MTHKRKRFKPGFRADTILQAAILVATRDGGWESFTRKEIAEVANCSEGLVSQYLGTMKQARKAVMKFAQRNELVEIMIKSVTSLDGEAVKTDIKRQELRKLLGK